LIRSDVFVRYEDGQYVAVLERFSIIGMGDTVAKAWKQMDEHACSYLELCEEQGLPYSHVLRPLPWRERLRHRTHLAVVAPFAARAKKARSGEQRTAFIHAHLDNGFAHAAC
jgi:hypothetical protein